MDDFKKGFTVFLRPVYSVLVLFWIAQYFLGVFGVVSPVGAFSVGSIVGLISLLVLNALPETIYQKQYMGMDSLVYSIEFLRDNIINWIVPNLIFYLLIYMLSGRLLLGILPTGIGMSLGFNPIFFLREILGQTVFSFMMIYRGYLYRTLSNSTKRKREFMNKF